MAAEAQWKGLLVGAEIDFNGSRHPEWPNAKWAFDILELVFGGLFAVELLIKIACLRTRFAKDAWNLMDSMIVVSWSVSQFAKGSLQALDPRMLRLMRLMRLVRLVRLVRTLQGFDSLIIMTTAMRGSMSILMWTIIVLTLVLTLCALVLQALCEDYMTGADTKLQREEVYMFYGTFSRSLLTMFEITMGNWMPPCRALVENLSEWFMIFFVLHKLIIGFSVLAILNGVFMQETFKVANSDDQIILLQKDRAVRAHTGKMHALFEHLDDDGDGAVTLQEFKGVIDDPSVRTWLSSMDLDVRDVDTVFRLLDESNSGRLTAAELVAGVGRLKGQARSIDLNILRLEAREQWDDVEATRAALSEEREEMVAALREALQQRRGNAFLLHLPPNSASPRSPAAVALTAKIA